jgi:hypothetical protein
VQRRQCPECGSAHVEPADTAPGCEAFECLVCDARWGFGDDGYWSELGEESTLEPSEGSLPTRFIRLADVLAEDDTWELDDES